MNYLKDAYLIGESSEECFSVSSIGIRMPRVNQQRLCRLKLKNKVRYIKHFIALFK